VGKGRFKVQAAALIAARNFTCSLRSEEFSVHSSYIPVVVGLGARQYSLRAQSGNEVAVERPKGIPAQILTGYVAFFGILVASLLFGCQRSMT
jgi:hypothetical protein